MLFPLFFLLLAGCPPIGGMWPPPSPHSGEIIGTIVAIQGPKATVAGRPAQLHMPVHENEHVKTGPGSTITIQFSKGGFMQLHENTDPVFTIIRETMCLLIQMFYGDAILDTGGQCVNIDTPESSAFIHTKTHIRIENGYTTYKVLEGRIDVAAKTAFQRRIPVTDNQAVVVSRVVVERPKSLTPTELRDLQIRFRQIPLTPVPIKPGIRKPIY